MADTQDVKTQVRLSWRRKSPKQLLMLFVQLNAFRLRPKHGQSPASSPMSSNFSFPSTVTSPSNSSFSSMSSSSSVSSAKSSSTFTGAGSSEGPAPSKSRPKSHHRRKSSVSTRRESNEIMGIPCPDEVEDNSS